jgi:hypothetical protein
MHTRCSHSNPAVRQLLGVVRLCQWLQLLLLLHMLSIVTWQVLASGRGSLAPESVSQAMVVRIVGIMLPLLAVFFTLLA